MLELTPTDVKYIKTSGCQNYNVGDENKLDEEKIRRQSNRNYLKYNRSGWGWAVQNPTYEKWKRASGAVANFQLPNIHATGVAKEERRKQKFFEEIIAKLFPKYMKTIKLESQEFQIPSTSK